LQQQQAQQQQMHLQHQMQLQQQQQGMAADGSGAAPGTAMDPTMEGGIHPANAMYSRRSTPVSSLLFSLYFTQCANCGL
jgi:hypothetical protein